MKGIILKGALGLCAIAALLALWYFGGRLAHFAKPISVVTLKPMTPSPSAESDDVLRVAAYNIAHGRGGVLGQKNRAHPSREALIAHLDQIAAQIRSQQVDLIVLNEVDFDADWSFGVDQAEYLARKGGFPHLLKQKNMLVALPFYHLSFGNALLSRFPISHPSFIDFDELSRLESLLVGDHDGFRCEVQTERGPLTVIGIHLEYRSESIRLANAETIDALNRANGETPLLALGDFNSIYEPIGSRNTETSTALTVLLDQYGFQSAEGTTGQPPRSTFPSTDPKRRIDWILGRRIRAFTNPQLIDFHCSDQRMIVAEVQLSQAKADSR
jgi:endonuclease/exonuclease/phosphatase family metal-dependent hydrolase